MTTDSLHRRFGGLSMPVQASDVEDGQLFSVLDPAIDKLTAFCKAVVIAELGTAWDSIKANLTTTSLRTRSVVQDTCYIQPRRAVNTESNFDWPLLAVYRLKEVHDLVTLRDRQAKCEIGIDYILPPLPAEDERRLVGVLNAVAKSITSALEEQCHPAYQNGAVVFFHEDEPEWAIFKSIGTKRVEYGRAAFAGDGQNAEFPMVSMIIEAIEHDGRAETEHLPTFDGAYSRLHVGGSEGNIDSLVEFEIPCTQD